MFKKILIPLFFFIQSLFLIIPNAFSDSIEEVIVEAERQSGIDVLDESSSLKSFDLEDLETNQIASFGDVANFVPGLTASPTGSQGLRFTIRGIGARDSQLGVETRVGLYIDDAFLGRAVGSFDLVDLENDLRGQTRAATKCPSKKYAPVNNNRLNISGNHCNAPRSVDLTPVHLPPCQMIRYPATPLPPAPQYDNCPAPRLTPNPPCKK